MIGDAPVFAIYGRTLREINKDQIVNTQNERDCVVGHEMLVDGVHFRIERGVNPTYLKIWENGEEKQFAKMSETQEWFMDKINNITFQSFTNMIILNINHSKPFLEMAPIDKRPVLEDILQLGVYAKMNELVKKNFNTAEKAEVILEAGYKNKIGEFSKTKERKESIDKELSRFEEEKSRKIDEITSVIDATIKDKEILSEKIAGKDYAKEIKEQTVILKEITNNINENDKELRMVGKDIDQSNEVIKKLTGTPHCPLCATPTESPNIVEYIAGLKQKVVGYENKRNVLRGTITELRKSHSEVESKIDALNVKLEKYNRAVNKIKEYENIIKNKNESLTYEKSRVIKLDTIISDEDYAKLEAELKETQEKYVAAKKDGLYNKFIGKALGDKGIRKYITLKVIPFLNKAVNRYLSMLGSDYTITFNEDLKEKLISRSRDERSYASFSGGEKRRIDLSVLLALMDISKLQNSIDTNILILDEVLDTSLDNEGAQSFIEHLKGSFRQAYPDKCIYIITHRKDAVGDDSFDSIIHLVKENGFTRIDKVV
jgi:DNA repair exonuclease SbcCD ATPase subunit